MAHSLQSQSAFPSHMQPGDPGLQEAQGREWVQFVVRERVDALGQAHQPAALDVLGGQLW